MQCKLPMSEGVQNARGAVSPSLSSLLIAEWFFGSRLKEFNLNVIYMGLGGPRTVVSEFMSKRGE